MSFKNTLFWRLLATCTALMAAYPAVAADTLIDRASIELGKGTKVAMVRFGVQSDWERRWFDSNGTHLTGYWDLTVAHWRGSAYKNVRGQHQSINNIGLTPVFRFQSNSLRGWYGEGGIGINALSERYDNNSNKLSTAFQFGDHIGTGYVFENGWDLGVKIQHFSNGGYKKPNSGVNFMVVKLGRQF